MDRKKLEELWRYRVQDARLRLEFAQHYLREVQRDFGADDIPAADGNFAYQKALRAENFALAAYSRVLRVFTDLVVGGKIPGEGEWAKAAAAGEAE